MSIFFYVFESYIFFFFKKARNFFNNSNVIDTESRHISKEEAKEKVKAIVSKFSKDKIEFFYKKVDSTLRGNIGSEIEGFVESIGIKV